MSKGKRKSNPEALKLVRQRLNGPSLAVFNESDRAMLLQLCRLDMIQLLEEDLGMGPLKASQKNSVACLVDCLLQHQGHPTARTDPKQRSGRRSSGSNTPVQPALGMLQCPSSGGGSCHTPSTAPDEQRPQLHTPPSTNAGAVAQHEAAAFADCQPWLAELHQELAAAGNMWGLRGDDTTDTDDDTTGTEADSSWVPSAADVGAPPLNSWQLEQPLAAGGLVQPGAVLQSAALDTSQVEEMLVQQLLLDIESAPRRSTHKSSSFRHTPQQQLQQWPAEERQPPPLLQQKLQQLDQQQQMLKQQQQQLQQMLRRQQMQQEMQWMATVQQQTAAELDQRLQDELLQQLEAAGGPAQQQADPLQAPLPQREQVTPAGLQQQHQLAAAMGPAAPAPPSAAAGLLEQQVLAAPSTAAGLSSGVQPAQLASWPLPGAAGEASLPAAAAAAAAGAATAGAPGSGLVLQGLSDASLPLARGPRRLSLDGAGLVRKRDKMLMGLFAVKDEGLAGGPELAVELSGPSAELPTKRMSLTLPGCAEGASLPTSFSGRAAGASRPQPADLQQMQLMQLMQLGSCEDPTDVWQQSIAPAGQQQGLLYQQRDQQGLMQPGGVQGDPGAAASGGLAGRLKTLLRGKKAKARRHNSVGAGASFTSFAGSASCGLPTGRIPSDPTTMRDTAAAAAAAAAASDRGWPQLAPGQQGGHWGDRSSAGLVAEGRHAPAGARLWHSAVMPPVFREYSDPTMGIAAGLGGFSWHAEGGTSLAAETGAPGAGRQQQWSAQPCSGSYTAPALPPVGVAGSDSQFAQQLAQLRAAYGSATQQQHAGGHLGGDPAMMHTAAGPNSMDTSGKPGLVGKLVRALKLNGQPVQGPAAEAAADQGPAGQEDEELLVMGRSDGQLDLGAALQWQAGPTGPGCLEEVLQGYSGQMQESS